MSSTPDSIQHQNHSAGLLGSDPNTPGYPWDAQLREDQADAAEVDYIDDTPYPSPSQQSAIETLRNLEDTKVLELLSIIRRPGHVHHPHLEGLSDEQVDALSRLKSCHDSPILLWLRHFRGWKQAPS